MIAHLSSQPLGLGGKVHDLSSMVCLPQLHRFSEQLFQSVAEAATPPALGLHHFADRAQHMGHAFLLFDLVQRLRVVAAPPVGHHHSSIVRGNHLPHFFVAVPGPHLVDRRLFRLEGHQKGRLSSHSPSSVVGMDRSAVFDRCAQSLVEGPHRTACPSQGVLRDRPLGQVHPRQDFQHRRDLAHRDACPVVQCVGRRHRSHSHPVSAGPVLVGRNLGMPTSHLSATGHAPAYLHPVLGHRRPRNRWNVGGVSKLHSLILKPPSASRAGVRCHGHVHRRLGNPLRRRRPRCCIGEPIPGLRPGLLGLVARIPLEEGAA